MAVLLVIIEKVLHSAAFCDSILPVSVFPLGWEIKLSSPIKSTLQGWCICMLLAGFFNECRDNAVIFLEC